MITKTIEYTYDNNGNELTETVNDEVVVTNTYNSKNELIKTVSDKEINYTYNPEGKRIEKQDNEKIIKYVYEGLDIILELDRDNNIIASNIYGLSLVSRNSDRKGYYLYNGHGDTVTIVDNEQNEIKSYTYDEWGSIIEEVGEYDNPYRYAGYYYDEETGNYYLLSRYYNPSIARFIVEDSYRGEYNDPLSLNRYVYVVNNPLIYIDPEGYFKIDKFWKNFKEGAANVGITLLATGHAIVNTVGEVVIGTGKLIVDTGKTIYSGARLLGNEFSYGVGAKSEIEYYKSTVKYGEMFLEASDSLNVVKMFNGIKENFETTFNVENISKFIDKDTPYWEKFDYANNATKTALTLYGGYKVGKGIYNKVTVNTSGNITMYDSSSNLSNISLNKVNPYNGQTVAPYNPLLSGNISLYQSNAWNKNISLNKSSGYENKILNNSNYKEMVDVNAIVKASELKYSNTLLNDFKYENRKFMNYNSIIQEIIDSKKPIVDPRSHDSLLWHTPGSFNGTLGRWELSVNPNTKTIYHFNFNSHTNK